MGALRQHGTLRRALTIVWLETLNALTIFQQPVFHPALPLATPALLQPEPSASRQSSMAPSQLRATLSSDLLGRRHLLEGAVSCREAVADETILNLSRAEVRHSNLGGANNASLPHSILFGNVGTDADTGRPL